VNLVWTNLRGKPNELQLHCIGLLGDRQNPIAEAGVCGFFGCCAGFAVTACAITAFPLCAPIAEAAVWPLFSGAVASWGTVAGAGIYEDATREEICVLGDDSILVERMK
jgi:hypothetical protein